jgi:hypothetical protein
MNSQEFEAIILAYKKFKNSIKMRDDSNPPSYTESVYAYALESELLFLGIALLAAVAEQGDESFYDLVPENLELVGKFTKEQVITACHLIIEARANEVRDNFSRMQEFK